jgi:hypothetical protein
MTMDEIRPTTAPVPGVEIEPDVEAAVDAHMAQAEQDIAPEATEREVNLVRAWWDRTSPGANDQRLKRALDRDRKVLYGDGSRKDTEGDNAITHPRTLNNRDVLVSLCVPEDHAVGFETAPDVVGSTGDQEPGGEQREDEDDRFAQTVTRAVRVHFGEARAQSRLEHYVRLAAETELAWIKVTSHSGLQDSALSDHDPFDDDDGIRGFQVLLADYVAGEFTKDDAPYAELMDLGRKYLKQSKLEIQTGLSVDVLDQTKVRTSSEVKSIDDVETCEWICHDIDMTRRKVLSEFPSVHRDDLPATAVVRHAVGEDISDDLDVFEVREVHVYGERRILYMIDGLEYFADVRDEDNGLVPTERFYCFFPLVLNPRTDRLSGISQTAIQGPTEELINLVEDQKEDARQAAMDRYLCDSDVIDQTIADRVGGAAPNSMTGVPLGGRTWEDAVFALKGASGQINHNLYSTYDLERKQDADAKIPSQLRGETGISHHAAEVMTANRGVDMLTATVQRRVRRAMEAIYGFGAELLLATVGSEYLSQVIRGDVFWPADYDERAGRYRRLICRVTLGEEAMLDRETRRRDAKELIEGLIAIGSPVDRIKAGQYLGRAYGREDEVDDLMTPDATSYVQQLIADPQQALQSLDPQLLLPLAQLGEAAAQAAGAMMAEQVTGQGGEGQAPRR